MGFVINKNGEKIEVPNPEGFCAETVVLINDDTILQDRYIINIYKRDMGFKNAESEFITDVIFNEMPTDENIIYTMVQNGVNRYSGYATVEKIKVLDFKNEKF